MFYLKHLNIIWHCLALCITCALNAQVSPPDLNCATIQLNSDVELEWVNGANICYPLIVWASNNKNGPYSPLDTIFNAGTTTYMHNGANGTTNTWYYFMISDPNCLNGSSANSDTVCNLNPEEPEITRVSVVNNKDVLIEWVASISSETFAYIIYWDQNASNAFSPIDTVYGRLNTTYTHVSSADTRPETYTVAAMDSCLNKGVYNINKHKTMFLEDSVDRCDASSILEWSPYNDWNDGVGSYNVFLSLNGGSETQINQLGPSILSYTHAGLNDGDLACFRVEAISNSGVISSSNTICRNINIVQPPSYTYISNVTVTDPSSIEISFYADPLADLKYFHIYRKEGEGGFSKIAKITAPTNINQVFTHTDPNVKPETYYYQYEVRPQDSCNTIYQSQLSRSIKLEGEAKYDYTNILSWNSYKSWIGLVSSYDLYRKDEFGSWNYISTLGVNDSSYIDNISDVDSEDGIFCYKLVANEGTNNQNISFGISQNMASTSNEFCVTQWPPIHMPNAFTPEGANPYFKPVSKYIDGQNYKMIIYDRWGKSIIAISDPNTGWDGKFDGKAMPQGVYLYYIEFVNPDSKKYQKWGSFVLIH